MTIKVPFNNFNQIKKWDYYLDYEQIISDVFSLLKIGLLNVIALY